MFCFFCFWDCYNFVGWVDDSNIKNTERDILVTDDATYTAVFKQKAFSVTASSTTGGSAKVTTASNADGGKYLCGTEIKLEATPEDCYEFTQWSDGNTTNPRTVTVSDNASYTAEFAKPAYSVTIDRSTGGKGKRAAAAGGDSGK